MSDETLQEVQTGDLYIIECLAIDLRDAINALPNNTEVINYLNEIGVSVNADFCKRKRPCPPPK